MKWNIARGFRFEIKEETDKHFILQMKSSNVANKKSWQPSIVKVIKSKNSEGQTIGISECHEFNHSGFPSPALCLLNYKGKIDTLEINPRWLKSLRARSTLVSVMQSQRTMRQPDDLEEQSLMDQNKQ